MISTEILRRYIFFTPIAVKELQEIAILAV